MDLYYSNNDVELNYRYNLLLSHQKQPILFPSFDKATNPNPHSYLFYLSI